MGSDYKIEEPKCMVHYGDKRTSAGGGGCLVTSLAIAALPALLPLTARKLRRKIRGS